MESNEHVSPKLDVMARVICVLVGLAFGCLALLAHSGEAHFLLVAVLALVSVFNLVAGMIGPRSLRLALVTWMPWF